MKKLDLARPSHDARRPEHGERKQQRKQQLELRSLPALEREKEKHDEIHSSGSQDRDLHRFFHTKLGRLDTVVCELYERNAGGTLAGKGGSDTHGCVRVLAMLLNTHNTV